MTFFYFTLKVNEFMNDFLKRSVIHPICMGIAHSQKQRRTPSFIHFFEEKKETSSLNQDFDSFKRVLFIVLVSCFDSI